jgi:vacuolar-type H+-ATPase subunit I/STV1
VLTLKKVGAFLKTYWYLPVMLVILIFSSIMLYGRRKDNTFLRLFEDLRNKYEREVERIQEFEHLKNQEKEENKKKFDKALDEIEKKIDLKKKEIKRTEKKRVKELVEEHGDDYDKMAEIMADEFGFEVVK